MPIKFNCVCGKKIEAPDAAVGKKGKCPKCGREIVVPAPPGREQRGMSTEVVSRRSGPMAAPTVPCRQCGRQVPASSFDCPFCHAPVELSTDLPAPAPAPSMLPPAAAQAEGDLNATIVDDVFAHARPAPPLPGPQAAPRPAPPAPPHAKAPPKSVPPPPTERETPPPRAPDTDETDAPAPALAIPRSFACYMAFLVAAGGCLLQLVTLVVLYYVQIGAAPGIGGVDARRFDLHHAALMTLVTAPMAVILAFAGQWATRDNEAHALGRPYADAGMTFAFFSALLGLVFWFFPGIVGALPQAWR